MGKKIKITENQLSLITNHIKNSNKSKNMMNESFKDVILGVAMLMGINLTGQNKSIAQNILNDSGSLKQIKTSLSTTKLQDVIDRLEELGLKNPLDKIHKNAKNIKDNYSKYAQKQGIDPKLIIYPLNRVNN